MSIRDELRSGLIGINVSYVDKAARLVAAKVSDLSSELKLPACRRFVVPCITDADQLKDQLIRAKSGIDASAEGLVRGPIAGQLTIESLSTSQLSCCICEEITEAIMHLSPLSSCKSQPQH